METELGQTRVATEASDDRPPHLDGDGSTPESPMTPHDAMLHDLAGDGRQQDVAELQAEIRTLRAEVERARRVLDSVKDCAVITLNKTGRVTGLNTGARAILGYSDAELLWRSGEILFPAEDRAKRVFAGELRRASQDGYAVNERWHLRCDGSRFWASGSMMPIKSADGVLDGFVNVFRDNSAVRAEEERRALLLAEMGHRVKNTMATVQAVAIQTMHGSGLSRDVQDAFAARLTALARSHDMLIRNDWEEAPLAEVVDRTLFPYGGSDRSKVNGPPVQLPGNTVEMLGLAFHELATNAAKYGALSGLEGYVEVFWSLRKSESGTQLVEITWRERGGPPLKPREHRGFGLRLLERGPMQDLGGTVALYFRPEGLECHICLPVASKDGEMAVDREK